MLELQFLKTLIFPTSLLKLQTWVSFSIFSYLKFFFAFIINGITIISCEVGPLLLAIKKNILKISA